MGFHLSFCFSEKRILHVLELVLDIWHWNTCFNPLVLLSSRYCGPQLKVNLPGTKVLIRMVCQMVEESDRYPCLYTEVFVHEGWEVCTITVSATGYRVLLLYSLMSSLLYCRQNGSFIDVRVSQDLHRVRDGKARDKITSPVTWIHRFSTLKASRLNYVRRPIRWIYLHTLWIYTKCPTSPSIQ